MPFLQREDQVQIYYEVHGRGKPLILTHGFSSTSEMWKGQIEPLTKAGYQFIIWDMRGHGKSAYPNDQSAYSEKHTVADITALLDKVGGEGCSAIVGGLSLGGYMSLAFYRDHPQRVEALLIIDTGPGFKSNKPRQQWNEFAYQSADRFEREGLKPLQEASPERSQVNHRNAAGIALAARGMLTQHNPSIIESLPNVKVPAIVVVGEHDERFIAASEYMQKKIQDCDKVVIPKAGHAANMDNPDAFNKGIVDFLSSLKDRGAKKSKL